jgi:flagellar biosynthesis/type III secretory pathway chaperone
MNPQTNQQPNKVAHELKIQDVITLTARLAQLLAEEADLLGGMKMKEIEKLQHEKIFITNALEAQRKLLDRHPGLMDTIPSQDKADLQRIVDVFNDILEENHRKLLLAKEVNHKIVSAIKEVVREHTSNKTYGVDGNAYYTQFQNMSVTLDSVI